MDPATLHALGLALAGFMLAEAAIAPLSIVAIESAPAIASGIATALAVGGFAGGVATVALIGLAVVGVVALTVGAITVVVAGQAVLAQQLALRLPAGVGQTGEQTNFNMEPPPLVVRFSADPVGTLTLPGNVSFGALPEPGLTPVPEPAVPSFSTSLDLDLSPVPGVPDIGPDGPAPDPGLPGESLGLMAVVETPTQPVPGLPPLLAVGLGLGIAALRRWWR